MPEQKGNTQPMGVEIKTATVSSTRMAVAVAFLGAAALAAAAAAAGMGGNQPSSQSYGTQSVTSTPVIVQPIIKQVTVEVNGNQPVSFSKSVMQNGWLGSLSGEYEKMTDGRVVVTVAEVENKTPDLMYGYYVMSNFFTNIYVDDPPYVSKLKYYVMNNIVWSKSNQYSFKASTSSSDFFTVFVFVKNGDVIYPYSMSKFNLNFDDATEMIMTLKSPSTSPTTPTSTPPILPTPTSTPSTTTTPPVNPVISRQPILKEVSVEVNGTPKVAKVTTKNSSIQGNLQDDLYSYYVVEKTDTRVLVNIKAVENEDSSTLYGYYVSYDLNSVIKNYNTLFKGQITDKVVWTKSKQYSFKYVQPNFHVYVLVKNGDGNFVLPNLGIDDGTYLYLYKITVPSSTPTSTPFTTSTPTSTY